MPRTTFATPSDFFAAPTLPGGCRFVLFRKLRGPTKPHAFPTLGQLARHIHTARSGFGLQLTDEPVTFRDGQRQLTRVDATGADGERHRLIGHVWIEGDPADSRREVLEAALRTHEPKAPAQARAA